MPIHHVKQSRTLSSLEDWGPVGSPLSEPVCRLRGMNPSIEGCESTEAGFWECSPGRFRREVMSGEVMHFLSGECSFTPDDGEKINIAAGDTLFFSPNTRGVWEVSSPVRKVYVLL